ncbi:MAG: glycosyltransferase family 39 protein [Flavitalea sp.]
MDQLQNNSRWTGSVLSKLVFASSFIAVLLLLIVRSAMVFSYDPEITGIDNNFIYPVMQQLLGNSIYPDPTQYPFAVNPYAPLIFYLSYGICELLGITGSDPIEVYFVTRGICLVADVMTMFVLFRLMKRFFQVSPTIAAFGTVSFFYLISYWSFTVMRADSLLLLSYSLILFSVLAFLERPRIVQLVLLALLCNVAIFSKQNGIYLPFMVTGILILTKKLKAAWVFPVFFTIAFLLFLWCFIMSYGDNFFNHVIFALNNRIDIHWFYLYIFKRLVDSFVIIPFSVGCWFAIYYLFKPESVQKKAIAIAALCSIGFSLLIAFKWGSSIAYLNEAMFGLTIILSFSLKQVTGHSLVRKLTPALLICSTVIAVHMLVQLYLYHVNNRQENMQVYQEQKTLSEELLASIGNRDLYIYADDVNGTFFKNCMRGRLVAPNKDAIDCCTLPDGNFDYTLFRKGFATGKIRYLVFQEQWIPEQFHDISLRHYKKTTVRFGYAIYTFEP